jgi:hypothetical protein
MAYFLTVIYWFAVVTAAVIPGYALIDRSYLIMVVIAAGIYGTVVHLRRLRRPLALAIVSMMTIVVATLASPNIAYREISFPQPPNPFAELDGGSGYVSAHPSIFNWRYWNPGRYEREYVANVPNARLIKFSQSQQYLRLRGLEASMIVEAFGKPSDSHRDGAYEVWVYHPWSDHRDWTMPVYLMGGRLWSVGTPRDEAPSGGSISVAACICPDNRIYSRATGLCE